MTDWETSDEKNVASFFLFSKVKIRADPRVVKNDIRKAKRGRGLANFLKKILI